MYKVGIISDTHGLTPGDIYQKLEGVDYILHAGDLGSEDVLLDLEMIAPVYAVRGNIDFFGNSKELPKKQVVEINKVRFGLAHGDQVRRHHIVADLINLFQQDRVDVIIFGHTHHYYLKQHGSIWVVNPGSSNCNYSPTGILLSFTSKSNLKFEMIEFCKTEDLNNDYHDDPVN